MRLTTKLLSYLNRVFDKDPHPFAAFRVSYAGGDLAWVVQDGVLTTTVTGGVGQGLSIDLSQYTLGALVEFIAGQAGYALDSLDQTRQGLSALVLLDGQGDLSQPNGGVLTGYTSLLFAFLEAVGFELATAKTNVAALPAQMDLTQAQGQWIDQIASYYDVPRLQGESDQVYAPRVIATVFQMRQNNRAIEIAIQQQTGQAATVTDVIQWTEALYYYDGSRKYDGTQEYTTHPVANYGLFDVVTAYDLINLTDPVSFRNQISSICDQFRAAGAHLRAVSFEGSQLADSFTATPSDSSTETALLAFADAPAAAPSDAGASTIRYIAADVVTPPNDATDGLVITTLYSSQDSQPLYATTTTETIAGDVIISVTPPVPVQIASQGGQSLLDQSGDYVLEG
ncbi:MAG: hypothetical protein WA840_19750 [Caulobacteraceae bacterium]